MASLWKGLTPFATHLTLKYALRMGTNAFYQGLLRDQVQLCAGADLSGYGFMAYPRSWILLAGCQCRCGSMTGPAMGFCTLRSICIFSMRKSMLSIK